jgi:hypothetical protein
MTPPVRAARDAGNQEQRLRGLRRLLCLASNYIIYLYSVRKQYDA